MGEHVLALTGGSFKWFEMSVFLMVEACSMVLPRKGDIPYMLYIFYSPFISSVA